MDGQPIAACTADFRCCRVSKLSTAADACFAAACDRYRTQLCNDGTNCKRRVCFFAHTLSELRVPSSKPFVNPQALAAAAAAAGARRASFGSDQVTIPFAACMHLDALCA